MYRDLVFESAEHVFAEKGYDDATMQDIAAEAGVSLKTVYAAFPGKSELYAQIQSVRGLEFVDGVTLAMSTLDDPLESLAKGVRAYVDFLAAHENFLRIHLRDRVSWGLGPRTEPEAELWARGVAAFARVVRHGIERGVFHEGDAELMAMMGIAIMQVQLARLADGSSFVEPDALADEIQCQLRRLLCRRPDAVGASRRVA
jgi:AcrR family transcriptional regulator